MSEKEKLLKNLAEKSKKSEKELEKLIIDKINELSGLVSEEGAIYIIANELQIKLDADKTKKPQALAEFKKINQITEGKVPVSLVCRVIKKYDKATFSTKTGTEGSVQSLLVGDDTGVIRVVFWNDKTEMIEDVKEKDILKITNAYSRENPNLERIELSTQYSELEINPKGVDVKLKEFVPTGIEFKSKKISELNEGDKNVKLNVIVTDFDIPRYYLACPECFKKIFLDEGVQKCAVHNEITATKIPIVNLIVDDGNNTIAIVGFRDRAENLTGAKADEIISLTQDIDKYRNFSRKIIGSKMDIAGNVSVSALTGDKQFLVSQVLGVEFKDVSEIVDELVSEGVASKTKVKKEEKKEPKTKTSETKIPKKEKVALEEEINLDIEEINFDDDLL